ncbi:MAG: glycosyltransferase family 2 protein [Gammaproteobacteria bacterium]|nr:glycosyltransferase family 2 protein [Gammaproteobacteria bacterium]
MSVFNGSEYLEEAIYSIRNQSFKDFEFIIVDDGSIDNSIEIIQSSAIQDSRIKLIVNSENLGLAASLNKGMRLSAGKYIARMDADDVSASTRLQEQYNYMENHPDTIILGTWMKPIGEVQGENIIWEMPVNNEEILANLCFDSVICHPSVMMRGEWIRQNEIEYDETLRATQDYDLWIRLSQEYSAKFENLPSALVSYRVHTNSVSNASSKIQQKIAKSIYNRHLNKLGVNPSEEELNVHQIVATRSFRENAILLEDIGQWLLKLKEANRQLEIYPILEFENLLEKLWYRACYNSTSRGLETVLLFIKYKAIGLKAISLRKWFNLIARSIVK